MTVRNSGTIKQAVLSWEHTEAHAHRFGGTEYRIGKRELGHVHGDTLVDIPFPNRVRDELVADGEAEPHHILPESSWISFYIREPEEYGTCRCTAQAIVHIGVDTETSLAPVAAAGLRSALLVHYVLVHNRAPRGNCSRWRSRCSHAPSLSAGKPVAGDENILCGVERFPKSQAIPAQRESGTIQHISSLPKRQILRFIGLDKSRMLVTSLETAGDYNICTN